MAQPVVVTGIPIAEPASSDTTTHRPPLNRAATESALHGLNTKGYPLGLCNSLRSSLECFPLRIWVVDNSGSMASSDGARFVNNKKIRATRWQELGDTVNEMGELSTMLHARTDFHFLNMPRGATLSTNCVSVGPDTCPGVRAAGQTVSMDELKGLMRSSPTGGTPLAEAVNNICDMIAGGADKLRAHGQQVVVVIATDGLPNDAPAFLRAMQRLQTLPVWVVVRLCTSQDSITEYYANLDKDLESPLEVLDDICGEAEEVRKVNGWLAYGPPLHQLREWGLQEKLFDLLDEQPMIPSQCKQFIEYVLGCKPLPEPEADQAAFLEAVTAAQRGVPLTFDPIKLRAAPWFDVAALKKFLGGGGGCSLM